MKNEKLNNCLEVGAEVLYKDPEGGGTHIAWVESLTKLDGDGNPYFTLFVDGYGIMDITGVIEDFCTIAYEENVGFPILDKIRIEYEKEIVEVTGSFEPLSGDNGAIYGFSDEKMNFYDIKLTTNGFIAIIDSGKNPDVSEKYEIVRLIPLVDR